MKDQKEINMTLNYGYILSPMGILQICAKEDAIISIDFVKEKTQDESTHPIIESAKNQLTEYFNGERKIFDLKLELSGTDFQVQVWKELMNIPYGATASYGEIAQKINNERACRAVGGANNKNPIAIVIPCHRVIGANKSLVGYGGGLWRKEALLKLEGNENLLT